MSSFLNRKINESRGNDVGTSTTWEALYKQLEVGAPGSRIIWRDSDIFISGNTFETSVVKELSERRRKEKFGNVAVYNFPEIITNDKFKLYWMCLNLGSYLTGNTKASGNAMHLACNSLSSASWNFAESPTEDNKDNFVSKVYS